MEAFGMLTVIPRLVIDESELEETFVRASGPGGQNVNKVATAVQLRFDIQKSPSLPIPVRERLRRLAGKRITGAGILIIDARRFRTRQQNRLDARERLTALIRRAADVPKPRRPTRSSKAAQQRRIEAKRRRGTRKRWRGYKPAVEE
jgi:ribosome-associated protein